MTDANTICHDVDLLGDWLDAKGYTEEAGLCLRALGLIHAQEERIKNLQDIIKEDTDEILRLRAENEKLAVLSAKASQEASQLRAALKPFAYDYGDYSDGMWSDLDYIQVSVGDLRAARAALGEKE